MAASTGAEITVNIIPGYPALINSDAASLAAVREGAPKFLLCYLSGCLSLPFIAAMLAICATLTMLAALTLQLCLAWPPSFPR